MSLSQTQSLQEARFMAEVKRNSGQGAQTSQPAEPPTDPAGAVRETLAAVLNEIRQRRFQDVKDHQLLSHARRLVILARDIEAEERRQQQPPLWRRLWFWLNTRC